MVTPIGSMCSPSPGPWMTAGMATSLGDQVRDRREHLVRMLEMRRVPAGDVQSSDRAAQAALDRVELGHRPVGVVLALDEQRRRAHRAGGVLDVPRAELGVEPDVAPAVEGGVDVAVM